MNIIDITKDNRHYIESFISQPQSTNFRYYQNRTIDVLDKHVYTVVGISGETVIAYGHIDLDTHYWIGLEVVEQYHRNGYGKAILNALFVAAKQKGITELRLSVDNDNLPAIGLYTSYGFQFESTDGKALFLTKQLRCMSLPVSYGESLDKLSILDIKLEKIKDDRRNDVLKEYNAIKHQLEPLFDDNIKFHYNIIKQINLNIWNMQDELRITPDKDRHVKLCFDIIDFNDRRFRVKSKINTYLNSELKEQKGYVRKKALILMHLGLGDHLTGIGIVRSIATQYDEVVVVTREDRYENMLTFFTDDPTIKLYCVPQFIYPPVITGFDDYTKFKIGSHGNHRINDIPFSFYKDAGLPYSDFWNYFHIPTIKSAQLLYSQLQTAKIKEYIFAHSYTSSKITFGLKEIESKLNVDHKTTLIINPNKNYYDVGHKWHSIAESYVMKPMIDYTIVLKRASKVVLTDSSFMCLALNTEFESDEIYYIERNKINSAYGHIWSPKYKFPETLNRRVFIPFNI